MRWLVAWKLATIASNSSTLPACSRPSAPARSAPAEKGSFGCQITRPWKSRSAMRDRFLQAVEHVVVDRVHLGLEADHRDAVAVVPHAHAVVLEHRLARRELLAEHRIGEALALVDRSATSAARSALLRRAVAALGAMHAVAAVEHPVGQRRIRSWPCRRRCPRRSTARPASSPRPARSRTDRATSRSPSGSRGRRRARCRRCRPGGRRCSGTGRGSTAHRNCACGCSLARSLANFSAGSLIFRISTTSGAASPVGGAVVLLLQVEHQDVLAELAEDAGAGLLAQRALGDQRLQPVRRLEVLVPRIVRQGVGHGLDDVGHGVQADHVRGAVGRRLRAADQRAGERVDLVEAQAELLRCGASSARIENTPMRLPMKFGVSLA